ncbi:MAG: hypothetical protein ACLGIJ_12775 [Candidatus Limnocylindria bacterium]
MGPSTPSNPWSPGWRPDPSGGRLAAIRTARRGMVVALAAYAVVAAGVLLDSGPDGTLLAMGLAIGIPAVMLLGAGLATTACGGRIDAVAAALAFAVGMPVAAVTSLVIAGWVLDGFATGSSDLAGTILRRSVTEAVAAAPFVAAAAGLWVAGVRRLADRVAPPGSVE